MQSLDLYGKLKRFKLLDPFLSLFLIAVLLLSCFFYSDYSVYFLGPMLPDEKRVVVGGGSGGGSCDWFDGEWVWDEGYPLYEEKDCGFIDDGFKCKENGRPDGLYTKWRWHPRNCALPRCGACSVTQSILGGRLFHSRESVGMCLLGSTEL